MIYLDNASTTRVDSEAVEVIQRYLLTHWENPSAINGENVDGMIEETKNAIREYFNLAPESKIYFTSGATESNNWVISALTKRYPGKVILTSPIEHHSITMALKHLYDYTVIPIPVSKNGLIIMSEFQRLINENLEDIAFVTVMHTNNEIGTEEPIDKIYALCNEYNIPFHTDATQGISRCYRFNKFDTLSFSAHKIHGPKGIGVLIDQFGLINTPLMYGGQQQDHLRPGTENTAYIAALNKIFSNLIYKEKYFMRSSSASQAAKYFLSKLSECKELMTNNLNWSLIGTPLEDRDNGIVNLMFKSEKTGKEIQKELFENSIICSTGSACNSGSIVPNEVIMALGYSSDQAERCVRFSFGDNHSQEEIDYTVKILTKILGASK